MPNNLVLIRHGESEGNIATTRSKHGDHSAYQGEFLKRHSSLWRLSPKGIWQAQETGKWLREELRLEFDRLYVSEYLRAMETAGHLNLPGLWYPEFYLRERNWGKLDRASIQEREEKFQEVMKEREVDSFYWTPPDGESLADVCLRVDRVIQTLHRECDGKNVIIVCHGEVMWAFRVRLERMSQEVFHQLDSSRSPLDRIHNCTAIHYTKTDPSSIGSSPGKYLEWMKILTPWDKMLSQANWSRITRKRYSGQSLLQRVELVTPLVT